MSLSAQHCTACRADSIGLTSDEAAAMLTSLPGWELDAGGSAIIRHWNVKNFAQALALVNQAAIIAEAENHHPDIAFGWGYVTMTLSTHSIGGLHLNDMIIAAKLNEIGAQ